MADATRPVTDGILNVDKPRGPTSRDIVNAIQRCVRPLKVGHAGTLDPLATGVLVVCLGQATRLVEYIQQMRKRYRASFRFGWRSDTDDIEGQLEQTSADWPAQDSLQAALDGFRGEIQQVPPAYSAVKVQGQRAYRLARAQREFELAPRSVTIWQLELVAYDPPDWVVDVECSSGTYIRALGRDVAQALQTSCVMTALSREAVGPIRLEQAVRSEAWQPELIGRHLQPLGLAVSELPRVTVTEAQARWLTTGRGLSELSSTPDPSRAAEGEQLAAFTAEQELVAILEPRQHTWHPRRCFQVGRGPKSEHSA